MTIARKQNLSGLRKCSGGWWFCSLFNSLASKKETEGGFVKSAGGRLGRSEKAKRGDREGWIEGEMERDRRWLRWRVRDNE